MSKRTTIESLQRNGDYLDACELRRLQLLTTNRRVVAEACWRWKTIQELVCEPQCLIIHYRDSGLQELVPISYSGGLFRAGVYAGKQRRDGGKPHLHCPRCEKRYATLYCVYGRFMCRQCGGLRYRWDTMSHERCKIERLHQVHARLDDDYKRVFPVIAKRKKLMRRVTFTALHKQAQRLVSQLDNRPTRTTHRRGKYELMRFPAWKSGKRLLRIYRDYI